MSRRNRGVTASAALLALLISIGELSLVAWASMLMIGIAHSYSAAVPPLSYIVTLLFVVVVRITVRTKSLYEEITQ